MFNTHTAPQQEQPNPPKVRRGFTFDVQNARRDESNPTRQKSAEGSLSMFKMRTAPQREQPNPPKVRRGFTFDVQNARRATTRATQPAKSPQRVHFRCSKCAPRHDESSPTRQKSAEGSLSMFKMRTAPQREQPNPPKVRRGFTFDIQNAHRATAGHHVTLGYGRGTTRRH